MKLRISVCRCLKSKTMLVRVKKYIKKNFAACKSLCKLQELYTAFKEKHPNVNIEFSKVCALRPKWCVPAGSKMTHSVCVCSAHQNSVATRYSGLGLDIQRPDQINFVLPEVFPLKFICDHFCITIIHKSLFLTGISLVHLIWKCS